MNDVINIQRTLDRKKRFPIACDEALTLIRLKMALFMLNEAEKSAQGPFFTGVNGKHRILLNLFRDKDFTLVKSCNHGGWAKTRTPVFYLGLQYSLQELEHAGHHLLPLRDMSKKLEQRAG